MEGTVFAVSDCFSVQALTKSGGWGKRQTMLQQADRFLLDKGA